MRKKVKFSTRSKASEKQRYRRYNYIRCSFLESAGDIACSSKQTSEPNLNVFCSPPAQPRILLSSRDLAVNQISMVPIFKLRPPKFSHGSFGCHGTRDVLTHFV